MEQHDTQPPLTLLPATKAQRMLRIKDAWEKICQAEQTNVVARDVQRATVLAEALEEETLDGKITTRDLQTVTGISQTHIVHLLRYHRFRSCCSSVISNEITLTEGRFREYWKCLSDPIDVRQGNTEQRRAYERRIFVMIVEWLEAGKAPLKKPTPQEKPTVETLFKKKKPLTALRKEVERRFTQEFKPMAATLRDYLGRDRSTYTPTLMASASIALDKWEKSLEGLLKEFDNYVQE